MASPYLAADTGSLFGEKTSLDNASLKTGLMVIVAKHMCDDEGDEFSDYKIEALSRQPDTDLEMNLEIGGSLLELVPDDNKELKTEFILTLEAALEAKRSIVKRFSLLVGGTLTDVVLMVEAIDFPNDVENPVKISCRFIELVDFRHSIRLSNRYFEELMHAEHLQRIDILASSIVHDMNNTLIPIIGYTKMLIDELEPDNTNHDILAQIAKAAHRSRQLMQRVYTSSTLPEQQYEPHCLSSLVDESLNHFRCFVKPPIQMEFKIDQLDRKVVLNPMQLRIVLIQLIRNAFESFAPRHRGLISINLSEIGDEAKHAKQHPRLRNNAYALITVKDNGGGMTDGQLGQVFDPFFTSSKAGKGRGLGLAMVHSIVLEHNGEFVLESEIGEGATSYVYLPFVEKIR